MKYTAFQKFLFEKSNRHYTLEEMSLIQIWMGLEASTRERYPEQGIYKPHRKALGCQEIVRRHIHL